MALLLLLLLLLLLPRWGALRPWLRPANVSGEQ